MFEDGSTCKPAVVLPASLFAGVHPLPRSLEVWESSLRKTRLGCWLVGLFLFGFDCLLVGCFVCFVCLFVVCLLCLFVHLFWLVCWLSLALVLRLFFFFFFYCLVHSHMGYPNE